MPAPIIRKIAGLEKRIIGKSIVVTRQNIHQNLQNGVGGLQIGYDFTVSQGNQNIGKLFDGRQDTHVNIKHNDKDQWLIVDLGKNRQIDRIVLEAGPALNGDTNVSWDFDLDFFLFKSGNYNDSVATADLTDLNHPIFNQNQLTSLSKIVFSTDPTTSLLNVAGTGTTQGFQYVAIKIHKNTNNNHNGGYINLKNIAIYESFDTRDYMVEFNDSVLDMHSWTGMRYKGCKTNSKKINKYNPPSSGLEGIGNIQVGNNFIIESYPQIPVYTGDITMGKVSNVQLKTTALYITKTLIGGTDNEDEYARIKHHSYVGIDKILLINLDDDTVKILDRETEDFDSFHRYVTTDFPTSGKFNIKVLDNYIQENLKPEYTVKMNKGWLLKSFEYNSEAGPLPGMDKDKTTPLNVIPSDPNGSFFNDSNVLYTIANPLSLYDAVSGSVQQNKYVPLLHPEVTVYGYNFPLQASTDNDPLNSGIITGLYGCQEDTVTGLWCGNKSDEDYKKVSASVQSLYDVFSYGPYYGNHTGTYNSANSTQPTDYNHTNYTNNIDASGSTIWDTQELYNQHAGGDLRFRFGVTSFINDIGTDDITGIPKMSFYPLYVGDNTKFVSNKFTREFIKQENNTQLGVKNFDFPKIEDLEFKTSKPFAEIISDSKLNPSVTASLFIGQCVQYLNSHSKDTELHLTFFEGTKDFSGNNDELSIGTFEIDRNVNSGYLDFANNLGKLYNTVGPRAKYLKLKNSPQFRPNVQPKVFDRYVYDNIETSDFQALISERQNSFIYGPGTINYSLDNDAGYRHIHSTDGQNPATYDNSPLNSDNFSGSFQYEISFLDKDHTLITDIDKDAELFNGIGGQGAVLIPEHTHTTVKNNLYYYLEKAGLIDRTTVKKVISPKFGII